MLKIFEQHAVLDMLAACDRASLTMEELERACCICGHHVYKEIWEAAVGEVLSCERKARIAHDRYAVAVKVTGTTDIVGHLPWKVSRVCSLFLRRGGTLDCTVTGARNFRCVNYLYWKIFR